MVEELADFSTGELSIGVTRNGELSDAVFAGFDDRSVPLSESQLDEETDDKERTEEESADALDLWSVLYGLARLFRQKPSVAGRAYAVILHPDRALFGLLQVTLHGEPVRLRVNVCICCFRDQHAQFQSLDGFRRGHSYWHHILSCFGKWHIE